MDRKIQLGNGYTLEEVYLVQETSLHIPYFAFAIVNGPKGGKYGIDIFTFENIMKRCNIKVRGSYYRMEIVDSTGFYEVFVSRIFNDKLPKYGKTAEDFARVLSKEKGVKYIERKNTIKFVSKMCGKNM